MKKIIKRHEKTIKTPGLNFKERILKAGSISLENNLNIEFDRKFVTISPKNKNKKVS